MAVSLGTAYLELQPSTKGLVPGIRSAFKGVEKEGLAAGENTGAQFATGVGKKSGGVKGMMGKLGLIGLGITAANELVSTFTDGIAGAADLEQSKGAISAVFKDDAKEIDKAAREAAKNLGLSRNAYNELASTVGAGLKNKGIQDFSGQTQKLIGLGADLAAQFGGDTATAVEAIGSLMRGEADPIERYGVSINETAVNAELAARGQDKLTGAALESAKAQARLDILMRQTTDAQGTFARESDTVAGKQQRAKAQWEDLKTEIGTGFLPAVAGVTGFFSDKLLPGIGRVTDAWKNGTGPMGDVRDLFDKVSIVVRDKVAPIFDDLAKFVNNELGPALNDFGRNVVKPIMEGVVIPLFGLLADVIREDVGPVMFWLWDKVVKPTMKNIGDAVGSFGEHWATIWGGIQKAAAAPVNFIIGTIWNDGLRKVFNLVRGVLGMDPLSSVPLVSWGTKTTSGGGAGGRARAMYWSGGYTGDGGKYEPKGVVHGGEYVLTKEEVQALGGPQALEARKHDWLAGYALGGYVNPDAGASPRTLTRYKGKTFSRLFAGFLRAAEQMSGADFRISQGGYRPRTSYSGTSHQGDAVDILGPITNGVIRALRVNGIAAWDRTGKGNWAPHIHGVPLPGRGYAAGSAVWQAQDYLRGGDGLGGRDNGPRVNSNGGADWLEVPGMLVKIARDIASLGGAWGGSLKGAFDSAIGGVKDWIAKQLGFPVGGYAGGTSWASPGLAWVGERGPELVNFRGGERVYSAGESAGMASGVRITNHVYYPVAEPASVTTKRSLDQAASLGY